MSAGLPDFAGTHREPAGVATPPPEPVAERRATPPPIHTHVHNDAAMGLTGPWKTIGNMSLLVLFGGLFYLQNQDTRTMIRELITDQRAAAREERTQYRLDLATLHKDYELVQENMNKFWTEGDKRWAQLAELQLSMREMASAMRGINEANVKIIEELKRLKGVKPPTPVPNPIPPEGSDDPCKDSWFWPLLSRLVLPATRTRPG